MPKTETNLKKSEDFLRSVLQRNFRQQVAQDDLRAAAERLCEVIPEARQQAA